MKEISLTSDGPYTDLAIGVRVCYKVPERGGFSLGFGDVTKINKKSVTVDDMKNPGRTLAVDKSLIYRIIIF